MKQHITIDGSQGEGGGQILRSSLALSLITGKSLTISNIRANRKSPGLRRQHLTALEAATVVGRTHCEDAKVGTMNLFFEPNGIRGGEHEFDIKTAGSTILTLQTVLPALMIAEEPSKITIYGGTHNPMAPSFDFLQQVFLPLVNRLGPKIDAKLVRYGFYPRGGGKIEIEIQPVEKLQPLKLTERGKILSQGAKILISCLPEHIAEREQKKLMDLTGWEKSMVSIERIDIEHMHHNSVMLSVQSENLLEMCTAYGEQGVRAETVAKKAAKEYLRYIASEVPVGDHLADQLLLPLGIAAWQGFGASQFITGPLTEHSTTHIDILRKFLDIPIHVEELEPEKVCVKIG